MPADLRGASAYSTTNAFGSLSFTRPVGIVSPPGETTRLFIVEQPGRIIVITNLAAPTKTTFLDISGQVQFQSEQGLLSLAFHPGYATNRYFYIWYTTSGTRHDRLSRFETDPANPARVIPGSELIILNQVDDAENHNGGEIVFGPDGYLYLSLGDEGGTASNDNTRRIDRDFFAGIIRIDVDKRPGSLPPNPHPANNSSGTFNYAIPPDNPFIGITSYLGQPVDPGSVRTEFWAVGLRNPWRISFDPTTGLLYCADVGQKEREEVNIITRGGHYGWPYFEGSLSTGFGRPLPAELNPIAPIQEYGHGTASDQGDSITGGFVYRGDRTSELYGTYLFADYISGHIWFLRHEQGNTIPFTRLANNIRISTFGIDPSTQDILIADHSENRIKRLVGASSPGPEAPPTLADTGAFSDLVSLSPYPGIVPYEINVPFWSDNAHKTRWFSIPNTNLVMAFDPTNNWGFPTGTVWIKHFDLEMTNGVSGSKRRIETRFLVRTEASVYGLTYRWGDSRTNATLVSPDGLNEDFVIADGGILRTQTWRYPSRTECIICHTPDAGFALGFNTPQLNCDAFYGGYTTNQISALSLSGYLDTAVTSREGFPTLARATNNNFSLEHRARSYLHANCVQCHQPGGAGQGFWDARITTPLSSAGIVNGPLADYLGDPDNRVLAPGSLTHSMLYSRIASMDSKHMPPLATSVLNTEAVALLREWITTGFVSTNTPPVASSDTIQRYLPGGAKVTWSALLTNDFDADDDPITFVSVSPTSLQGGTVTQADDWIYYTAPAGFTNDDAFTYSITDGRSQPVSGTVNVVVAWDPRSSPNLSVINQGDGSYRIRFDGIPDLTYRIEYTDTLAPPHWQTIGNVTANQSGQFEIVDTPPAGFGQRFYRSRYP